MKLTRETLHIGDDTGRIALIDTPTVNNTTAVEEQLLRYQYSNHLQSASLELDAEGAVISYEEYYPYGSTSFQSGRSGAEVSLKRYRYTGKERDEESGLYYHGARYYVPWLGRWCSVDPLEAKYAGMSPYNYSFNNPVRYNDPSGMDGDDTVTRNFGGETLTVDKNYAPCKKFSEMDYIPSYSFPYKWQEDGHNVTAYFDEATGNTYSILEKINNAGQSEYFSWVNKSTGQPELFDGNNLKEGHWLGFETAEQRNARVTRETTDAITNIFMGTTYAFIATPAVLELAIGASSAYVGQALSMAGNALSNTGRSALQGSRWLLNNYGKDAALKPFNQLAQNNGDWSKVDKFDLAVSIVNPLKKYGAAGKVITDVGTSLVDYKNGELKTALPINYGDVKQKETSEVLVDFGYSMSKTMAKDAFNSAAGESKARDFFIDYMAGQHKKMLKPAIRQANQ